MKSDTDTGNMPKEAMSVTEQVERKKNDTEKDDTERKRRPDTSHLAGLLLSAGVSQFDTKREIDLTSGNESKHSQIA